MFTPTFISCLSGSSLLPWVPYGLCGLLLLLHVPMVAVNVYKYRR